MGTNPPLHGELLHRTQIELVSTTTAAGTLYGIAIVLYYLYLHASLPPPLDHNNRRRAQFMIACSTIIMICGFYNLLLNAWVIQDSYIKHNNFPGGPLVYEDSTFRTQPVVAVGFVCQSAVDIITAAIQIWRLWVVWSDTRYTRFVIILPLLILLGFTALEIRVIVPDITLTDGSLTGSKDIHLGTAVFALRATAVILPTTLIAGFIIAQSRRQSKLTGKSQLSNLHMRIVAMLVESFALESTWLVVLVILFTIRHPVEQFFNDTLTYIEIITYLLVLYRVANRRAYGSQGVQGLSSRRDGISSLHWNHTTTSGVDSITDINAPFSGIRSEPNTIQKQGLSV